MTVDTQFAPADLIARKAIRSVSFALYGTLLLRKAMSIDGLYERTVQLAPLPDRLKQIPESFIQHRNLAQNRLRIGSDADAQVALVSGVAIERIYDNFAVHGLGLPPSIRPSLVAAELAAECELALLNPDILPLIEAARAGGKRVGVVAESHWSADQIRTILAAAAPGLDLDFIHSSASPGIHDHGGLFKFYLAAEGLKPSQAAHIGIDQDTVAQPLRGLAVSALPAAFDVWENERQREIASARMLASSDKGFVWRLDDGFHLLRDKALAENGVLAPHHRVGAAVMGPLMAGFCEHIKRRVAEISAPGRKVRLLFLARDGYLPMRIWNASGAGPCDYVELNRRIAMVAATSADEGLSTVRALISSMAYVKPHSIQDFFKIKVTKKIKAFFDEYPDQLCPAAEFAEEMPRLLGRKRLTKLSDAVRASLMEYLVAKLGPLSGITDLILADIGYTGNIQKALRRVFELEGVAIRLHGLYLMPHGESFVDLPEGDTVSGYFDDTVSSPSVKRAVMRDAPLIEEFCCAPVGSTKGYVGGREVREPEVRIAREIAFCLEVQDEAVRYCDALHRQARRLKLDPFADYQGYRVWSWAVLARFIMMPTPMECETFGPLLHDVSLGTKGLIATITTKDIHELMGSLPMPAVCSIHHPPVWLGGSLTAHNAVAGLAYAATGFGLPTDDILRDVELGEYEAVLVKDDRVVGLPVVRSLTPFGDLRFRIPILKADDDCSIALPLRPPVTRGVIRSLVLQGGDGIGDATTTRHGNSLSLAKHVEAVNAILDGNFFRAAAPDALLMLKVPRFKKPVSVLTLLVTPLFED